MATETQRLTWHKRKERGDGYSPEYVATDSHGEAGSAVRTGRYGSDDYPWDWSILPLHTRPEGVHGRNAGSADTLRSAKDQAEQAARLTR